jgi:hypothetical protein
MYTLNLLMQVITAVKVQVERHNSNAAYAGQQDII